MDRGDSHVRLCWRCTSGEGNRGGVAHAFGTVFRLWIRVKVPVTMWRVNATHAPRVCSAACMSSGDAGDGCCAQASGRAPRCCVGDNSTNAATVALFHLGQQGAEPGLSRPVAAMHARLVTSFRAPLHSRKRQRQTIAPLSSY